MTKPVATIALTPAPLWRRFAALFYDLFVLGGVSMGYGATVTAIIAAIQHPTARDYMPMFQGPLFFCGWLLVILAFFCGFWWRSGQTIGMRAWGIRVISAVNNTVITANPSIKQTLVRSGLGVLGLLLAGAGYWYRWFNPQGDCWHDIGSKTRVVRVDKHTGMPLP